MTLVEILIAVALTALLAAVLAGGLSGIVQYFLGARARQSLQADAESAMAVIATNLQQARASSVMLCANGSNPCSAVAAAPGDGTPPPFSRLECAVLNNGLAQGATFYWSNGAVYFQWNGGKQKLAQNVTLLSFALGSPDPQDFSRLNVSLRLDAAPSGFFQKHPASVQMTQSVNLLPQ